MNDAPQTVTENVAANQANIFVRCKAPPLDEIPGSAILPGRDTILSLSFQRAIMLIFLQTWEENLAYKGEWVQVLTPDPSAPFKTGIVISLEEDGTLQILETSGEVSNLRAGEIHPSDPPFGGFRLRPVDSPEK